MFLNGGAVLKRMKRISSQEEQVFKYQKENAFVCYSKYDYDNNYIHLTTLLYPFLNVMKAILNILMLILAALNVIITILTIRPKSDFDESIDIFANTASALAFNLFNAVLSFGLIFTRAVATLRTTDMPSKEDKNDKYIRDVTLNVLSIPEEKTSFFKF